MSEDFEKIIPLDAIRQRNRLLDDLERIAKSGGKPVLSMEDRMRKEQVEREGKSRL